MANGDVHTVPHGDGWANKVEGNQRVSNSAATKADAQKTGRDMAIKSEAEHLVHNKNGQISQRNTYPRSRDPRRSRG